MSIRKLTVSGLALATGLLGLSAVPAQAAEDVYLVAGLRGANVVSPAVGDPDGQATVALKISGDRVSFAIRWSKVGAPASARVHLGDKGASGAAQFDLVTGTLPATALGVTGTTTADPAVLAGLSAGPIHFYADLGGGAVRGQFHRVPGAVDLRGVLQGGDQATLSAQADGAQERPPGDQDGAATWWLKPAGSSLAYTATWQNLAAPTSGVVGRGTSVVAPLFDQAGGLPANLTGLSGQVPASRSTLGQVTANPAAFHADLRTTEFPAGAVRGSLSGTPFAHPRSFAAEVLLGAQIYECRSGAFGQFGVAARLRRGIDHSFVQPVTGPPQWVAQDGSAVRVSGVVDRRPNGDGNIPELVLTVSQSGQATGLLAQATQVLRLNTRAGVAPTGSCQEGAKAASAYFADYMFLGG
ncbi:CHRD domain-containing protein [Nonomuraea sp. NBC_01738]|uniref:CHRD domain-containing protein n=1 Tax=Nonomuraea sp. NBC_01738 TaxID=2976003 RepID=UPI002E0DA8D8|nr:CHRD domain-containing protein [Nonomuraea sp. NBC_01738]